MNCISRLLVSVVWLLAADSIVAAPIRVLILSGQTVHDTAATTPFLEQMYNNSGRFKVVATVNDVTKVTSETFAPCDVIVSNWTCHPVMSGGPWTPEGKKAFAEAIGRGKGMVSFHAACAACNDWPEFQEISGLTWIWDHTNHTAYHTFKVVIGDAKHPITKSVPDFWITDELYQRMGKLSKSEFKTLASAFADAGFGGTRAWEPMLITTQLGKGRGVNLLLGHDVAAMRNPAWQTLMLRSTEWAATGKVSIPVPADWPATPAAAAVVGVDVDGAIEAAAGYVHGQARGPLFTVEQLVNNAVSRTGKTAAADRAALAGKLAAAIASCKTSEGKAFLCRQLGMIGTPEHVPAIAPLLADEQAAMMARLGLERIPGSAAASALRDALPQLEGALRIGVIDSIGNRGDADSVAAVAAYLGDADSPTVVAAASALGKIGTVPAAEALQAARQSVPEALRPAITDACLACGERLLAAGDKKQAAGVYKLLYGPAEPTVVRAAALRGLVNSQPSQATPLIREALESSIRELHIAVADIIRTPKLGDSKAIAAAAMRVPADLRPIMIAALADRGDKGAANSLRRGLDDENEGVRLATIKALGRLGDEADAGFLADRAAKGTEGERAAALEVLRRMPAQAGEDAVVGLLLSAQGPTRTAAAAALVARPADKKVFELLDSAKDEAVQVELTRLLGQIGNEAALASAQRQAASESAPVRQAALEALTGWPTPAAMGLLLEAARKPGNEAAGPAIVKSVVRMLPGAELPKPEKARLIGEMVQIAATPEDKKAALELLSGYPVPEALAVAMSYVNQPDVADAAIAVVLRIAPPLADTHKEQVRSAMRELIAVAKSGEVIKQADAILLKANRPTNLARDAVADSPDNLAPDGESGGDAAGIDGDPATYWDEVDSQPLYRYRVTFKAPTRVSAVVLRQYHPELYNPRDFEILCDDKVVKTVRNASYDPVTLEAVYHFEPVTCSRVELKITGYSGKSPAIRELEIYESLANQAGTTQPSAASQPAADSSQAADGLKQ